MSSRFRASFLTTSPLVLELLREIGSIKNNVSTDTANFFLNFELPFLDDVDESTLMKVRQQDGEVFQNFRSELKKRLLELRAERDPKMLKTKSENLYHELSEIELPRLDRKVRSLQKKVLAEAGIVIAGLSSSVYTGGSGVLAAAMAAFQGYKTYEDYRREVRLNPSFMLWQVLGGSKKQGRQPHSDTKRDAVPKKKKCIDFQLTSVSPMISKRRPGK